jgi:hypothetical protein
MFECQARAKWLIILGKQNSRLHMIFLIWWGNTNKYIVKNKSIK